MTVEKSDGLFHVIVHNVCNVPSIERFRGLPDPYVNVFYHGSRVIEVILTLNDCLCRY